MTSFTFEGDPVLAVRWLPLARSQQLVLSKTGVPTRSIVPAEGVMIVVRVNPDHIHIIAAGGGKYFFMSYDDTSYVMHSGSPPKANEDGLATITADISEDATALNYGAPHSDRTAWYSKVDDKTLTVLSGYGNKYLINRFPHYSMSGGDLYSGFLELYENGVKVKTASFHGINGFLIEGMLVAVDTYGLIKYESDDTIIESPTSVPSPTTAAAADMIQNHGGDVSNGETYSLFYKSHQLQDANIKHSCNWQINKESTKAVSVSYINYRVTYEAIRDSDSEHLFDRTFVDIIPYLIEVDISITRDSNNIPTVHFDFASETIMSYEVHKQYLVAADFYYYPPKDPENQQSYEPDEGELILLLVEHYNYFADGRYYEGSPNNSVDSTLVVKSKDTEYLRDQYNFNADATTGYWKSGNGFKARLSSIDLRSMAYSLTFYDASNVSGFFMAKKIVFRGEVAFNKAIYSEGFAGLDSVSDYTLPEITENNAPNWYFGFQYSVRLDNRFAVHPFDNYLFSYQAWSDSVFDVFIYTETVDGETTYIPAFNYHVNSAGVSKNVDHLQCTANALVI